jgi:hypothetical protein
MNIDQMKRALRNNFYSSAFTISTYFINEDRGYLEEISRNERYRVHVQTMAQKYY